MSQEAYTNSTFVVDLNTLKHPDVKNDQFGKWGYSGSHDVLYSAWKSDSTNKVQFEKTSSINAETTV